MILVVLFNPSCDSFVCNLHTLTFELRAKCTSYFEQKTSTYKLSGENKDCAAATSVTASALLPLCMHTVHQASSKGPFH